MAEIRLSSRALAKLVERHMMTMPEEEAERGPSGPPGPDYGGPDPFEPLRLNPQPRPSLRRSALAARTAIARALASHESAEALADDGGDRAVGRIQGRVSDLVEDWCGTRPPRPYPWPWGPVLRGTDELTPADLLVAGAQFQKAAEALEGHSLRQMFQDAADRLLEQGAARLDQEG
jgi:hypothetical protein